MAKTLDDYDGVVFTSNEGNDFTIVQYLGNKDIEVEFIATGFRKWTRISDINAGKVRDIIAYNTKKKDKENSKIKTKKLKQEEHEINKIIDRWSKSTQQMKRQYAKTVQNIGYYGNVDKSIKYYNKARDLWTGILRRCYSGDGKDDNYFLHVEVCKRWHSLELFMDDLPTLIGFDKWVKGVDMQLDKDLLSDQKIYSPSTCLFLEATLNNQLQNKGKLHIARERIKAGLVSHIPPSKLNVVHREQAWVEFLDSNQ